jgi:hypothetical protein
MISRNTRLWLGLTFILVLGVNYALIGFPLYSKADSISEAAKTIYARQLKSGQVLNGSRDEYLLEVFRREKQSVDRALLLLNCISASGMVIVLGWTALGLVFRGKDECAHRD